MEQSIRKMQVQSSSDYSSLGLAYIGDAVYELIVREQVLREGNRQVEKLHRETTGIVNAASQAELMDSIMDRLTEEEAAIYKRARNAKQHTLPKNQSVADYKKATGFEAILGWLYLKGDIDRIMDLIS